MGKQNENGAEDIKRAIIAALNLLSRWELKLIYWIVRELISR